MIRSIFAEWLPRLIIAFVFLTAAFGKLQSKDALEKFVLEVRAYGLIPTVLSNPVAYFVPWFEGAAALMLLIGIWRPQMRMILVGLLIMFTAMKTYALMNGFQFECGCVPKDSVLYPLFNGWTGVGTNVALILLVLVEGASSAMRTTPATDKTAQPAVPQA